MSQLQPGTIPEPSKLVTTSMGLAVPGKTLVRSYGIVSAVPAWLTAVNHLQATFTNRFALIFIRLSWRTARQCPRSTGRQQRSVLAARARDADRGGIACAAHRLLANYQVGVMIGA